MTKPKLVRLSNGLPLILLDLPNCPSVVIEFFTGVGQRDGGLAKMQIAHVLEHMAFDGSELYPSRKSVESAIDGIGADFSAGTGEEHTEYYLRFEPKSFFSAIRILSQMVSAPLLKTSELEKEKKIIGREFDFREDESITNTMDILQETVFPDHPLGLNRQKAKKVLADLGKKDLVDFWNKNYVSGSSVLVLAGDLQKINQKEVERNFRQLKRGNREPLLAAGEEKPGKGVNEEKKTSQAHVALGVRGYPRSSKMIYAAKLLDIVFGHCFSSRLMAEIREKRKLAYAVMSDHDFYQDTGIVRVYAGVDPKRLEEAVGALWQEAKKITDDKAGRIREAELTKAKNIVRGHLAIAFDNPLGLANYFGQRWLFHHDLMAIRELLKKYEKVKREDLVEVARDLFRPERVNLVVVGEKVDIKKLKRLIA